MRVFKDFRFEAAHFLPNVPQGHKCGRMHGHSYRVRVEVDGEIGNEMGWVIDYADIAAVVRPILERLDHTVLNDTRGLENSTAEHLAVYLWASISPHITGLYCIRIHETADAGVSYFGPRA